MIHKCIFLIISSHDNPVYEDFRNLHRVYLKNYLPLFRYFFVEFRQEQEALVVEENDYIYIKGEENLVPGIFLKTIKAIEFINNNYNYDFLIRTNLSTIWNINNLLLLKQSLPNTKFAGGHILFNTVISGTGIIITRDLCYDLMNFLFIYLHDNEYKKYYNSYLDDVVISDIFKIINIPIKNIENICDYRIHFLIDDVKNIIPNDIENVLYFRIKNNDRQIDLKLFDLLINCMYNCME